MQSQTTLHQQWRSYLPLWSYRNHFPENISIVIMKHISECAVHCNFISVLLGIFLFYSDHDNLMETGSQMQHSTFSGVNTTIMTFIWKPGVTAEYPATRSCTPWKPVYMYMAMQFVHKFHVFGTWNRHITLVHGYLDKWLHTCIFEAE